MLAADFLERAAAPLWPQFSQSVLIESVRAEACALPTPESRKNSGAMVLIAVCWTNRPVWSAACSASPPIVLPGADWIVTPRVLSRSP